MFDAVRETIAAICLHVSVIDLLDIKYMTVNVAVSSDGSGAHTTGSRDWQARVGKVPVSAL